MDTKDLSERLWTNVWRIKHGYIDQATDDLENLAILVERNFVQNPLPENSIGKLIAEIAYSEIGVTEGPVENQGAGIYKYKAATWLDPKDAWPWCAAFVCWVLLQVAKARQVKWKRPLTAGARDLINWGESEMRSGGRPAGVEVYWHPEEVLQGDIIVYDTISHCGIAYQNSSNGRVQAVEGNTNKAGSREGDGVHLKLRKVSMIRAVIRVS